MDIRHLRTFVAIAATGHLGQAAERVHLSQPAASAHLKVLEGDLGVVLFERSAKGMRLSPAGMALLPAAERALAATDEVSHVARSWSGAVSGSVAIGTMSNPAWVRVGAVLGSLVAHHPKVTVSLHQGLSGALVSDVESGRLAAAWAIGRFDSPGLTARRLETINLCVVGPPQWGNAISTASLNDLMRFPWIQTPPKCSYHQAIEALFVDAGARPQQVVEADIEATLHSLAVSGVGLTLLRESTAMAAVTSGELVMWPGPKRVVDLTFVVATPRLADPVIQAVWEAVMHAWDFDQTHRPGNSR